jgi:2-keto-4-pentenoate hydratase/2-oxohepta-3-ene-1,7-dioic acid hydratase in catechol pathway
MSKIYQLLTYRDDSGVAVAGILVDQHVHAAKALLAKLSAIDSSSVLGLLSNWDEVRFALQAAVEVCRSEEGRPLADLKLEAPILYPRGLFATGANYFDHLEEMSEVSLRVTGKKTVIQRVAEPYIIMKAPAHSIIGPGAPIHYPRFSKQLDWEAEIGVVIGRGGEDIPVDDAMKSVAGYTIVNDLSARDMMKREGLPFIFDWFGQKCFADSAPMGPWITPAQFIPDPYNLGIKLWVNGVIKQNGNSKQMVYSIAEQIAYLSRHLVLRPGDVIATGCPAGVGMVTGDFLKVGDEIRIEVDGIGTLVNSVVAP